MLLKLMALVTAVVHMVSGQDRGSMVLHRGDNGESQSVIVTARTRAFLSCESGDIVVKVNFTQPFRGLMYAHRSRTSPCRIHGTGGYYYELRIPLKGCGTWQESPRVFVNNITIRFHSALELEEDETKTVVCRYPPPLTQSPGSVHVIEPPTVSPTTFPTRVGTAKLSEVEILIIICLLLFLSLLTLGIGIAYFCLKRRNIRIIRKNTFSSAPPSQITRLSTSHPPSSSLLSSVLGHTVRIPRAIPYSAPAGRASALSSSPDHHYEDYPASSSTAETASGELSETSVSSASLAEDNADASKNLLYRKGGPKSILSIPKAILRRAGPRRWRQDQPVVHQFYSQTASVAPRTSIKRLEMEDQTVTTVLESENHIDDESHWTTRRDATRANIEQHRMRSSEAQTSKSPIPVYAQVDKNRKAAMIKKDKLIQTIEKTKSAPPRPPPAVPGIAKRQPRVVIETPEESQTSEEVTKNTTVTTSVRKEVKETRIFSPTLDKMRQELKDRASSKEGATETPSPGLTRSDQESETSALPCELNIQKPPKSVLIRDVADIFVTTTVETELRELTTKVSRDVVEQHAKVDTPETTPTGDRAMAKETTSPSKVTSWNVVIRQREPCVPGAHLDASGESNGESVDEPREKPRFDVKIRAIPPNKFQPKKPDELISIPPLEIPKTVSTLKEALMPKTAEDKSSILEKAEDKDEQLTEDSYESQNKSIGHQPQRTVRWLDDIKDTHPDEESTVCSSDSFQSAESLRERSSSEVLEVAPTLPSQQRRNSNRPTLERSTSEIASPEDHVRWVGGVVPVLESLSPEFLANIPVVIQGGFFNRETPHAPDSHKE